MDMSKKKTSNKKKDDKKKLQIDKFKVFFKQSLSSDGEKVLIDLSYNNEFKDVLDEVILSGKIEFEKPNICSTKNPKRYKVKRVVYEGLMYRDRGCLFIDKLVDNGNYTFQFNNLSEAENFKRSVRENLNIILRVYLSSDIEQSVIYKVNLNED